MDPTTVEHEALRLPPAERAKLAQKLLVSLDALSTEELEQAWLTEAASRARELDGGKVQVVPAEDVQQKARALLR